MPSALRPACFHDPDGPRPPQAGPHDARNCKARGGEQHPVLPHPEDGLGIFPVPAVSLDDVEEAPAVPLVLVRHQDPNALRGRPRRADVLLPDHGEKERTRAVHDRDVRHPPVAVVGLQRLDHAEEERVLRDGAHGIVADASGDREPDPRRVAEEGVESTVAAVVQVHVGAAVVGKDEVADGIGALDREGVVVEGLEEPWILRGDELARLGISPELSAGSVSEVHAARTTGDIPCTRSRRGDQCKIAVHSSTAPGSRC